MISESWTTCWPPRPSNWLVQPGACECEWWPTGRVTKAGALTSLCAISRARASWRAAPAWFCSAATEWVSSIDALTIVAVPPPPDS